jgi:hypothetical protein
MGIQASEMGRDELLELGLRDGTLVTGHLLPSSEEDEGRQTLHIQALHGEGIGIRFKLGNLKGLGIGGGRPAHQGGHEAAWAAPGSPDIQEEDIRLIQDPFRHILVSDVENTRPGGGVGICHGKERR